MAWDASPWKTDGVVQVEGRVRKQGGVYIKQGTLLGAVLREAGWFDGKAAGITVHRPVGSGNVALRFNLAEDERISAPVRIAEFRVYPGDRVEVRSAPIGQPTTSDLWPDGDGANVRLLGMVQLPGLYRFAPATNVRTAIAIAGGLTPAAHPKRVLVSRPDGPSVRRWIVNLMGPEGDKVLLEPGDVVTVPESMY